MVILAVSGTSILRTPGNLYLCNLAASDLLLVCLACPATLAQISASSWPLPPVPELCRSVLSIVMSTLVFIIDKMNILTCIYISGSPPSYRCFFHSPLHLGNYSFGKVSLSGLENKF